MSGLTITTSWDDGHPLDLRLGAMLIRHGFAGTFYVPSRNSEGHAVMNAAQVAQLGRDFEIGGHTSDHVALDRLPVAIARSQITRNKAWLEDVTGRNVLGFCYPRGALDRQAERLVQDAGFRYARTIRNLCVAPARNAFRLPTTVQFYPHSPRVYLGNYLRRPTPGRSRYLRAALTTPLLRDRVIAMARQAAGENGVFHLWGHSWEIDQLGLWTELDVTLALLKREFPQARHVDNHGVSACAS